MSELELDALWEGFHSAVNMTSQELAAWLRVDDAAEDSESLPEDAGAGIGQQVLSILQKRRTDVTDEDVRVMYFVVDSVESRRGDATDNDPEAGGTQWRHQLMRLGHDPLKASA
ncbi:DUF3140 domain-containing protein [Streptomyces sp. NPDC051322]|uniref:DUF3140 domain-containing protein n=1 Tax=Streptomyces sp. NPDC051322 TaxID=3154645 RepID=UPI00344D9C4A